MGACNGRFSRDFRTLTVDCRNFLEEYATKNPRKPLVFTWFLYFRVCARASKIIEESLLTGFSSELRHRGLSKENFLELQSAKIVPEGSLGCLGRPHRAPLGPSWPPTSPSWRALGRSWALLGALGTLLERSWNALGTLGRSWALLGVLGTLL